MQEDPKTGRMRVSFEELAYSNMIVVEALVQLLAEKGLLSHAEITERVKKVKQETRILFHPVQ